jgi:hypothetical protein
VDRFYDHITSVEIETEITDESKCGLLEGEQTLNSLCDSAFLMESEKLSMPSTRPTFKKSVYSAKFGGQGQYYRKRYDIKNHKYLSSVHQITSALTANSHMYEETIVPDEEWKFRDSDCFLNVVFQRFRLKDTPKTEKFCSSNSFFDCYLDKIIAEGVEYFVLSLSCSVPKYQLMKWEDVRDSAMIKFAKFFSEFAVRSFPVYTKFMYMLPLTKNAHLYEPIFKKFVCGVDDKIDEIVENLLINENSIDKEYIWTVSHVRELYEGCISMGLGHHDARKILMERRKQTVENNDVVFRHGSVY